MTFLGVIFRKTKKSNPRRSILDFGWNFFSARKPSISCLGSFWAKKKFSRFFRKNRKKSKKSKKALFGQKSKKSKKNRKKSKKWKKAFFGQKSNKIEKNRKKSKKIKKVKKGPFWPKNQKKVETLFNKLKMLIIAFFQIFNWPGTK